MEQADGWPRFSQLVRMSFVYGYARNEEMQSGLSQVLDSHAMTYLGSSVHLAITRTLGLLPQCCTLKRGNIHFDQRRP